MKHTISFDANGAANRSARERSAHTSTSQWMWCIATAAAGMSSARCSSETASSWNCSSWAHGSKVERGTLNRIRAGISIGESGIAIIVNRYALMRIAKRTLPATHRCNRRFLTKSIVSAHIWVSIRLPRINSMCKLMLRGHEITKRFRANSIQRHMATHTATGNIQPKMKSS